MTYISPADSETRQLKVAIVSQDFLPNNGGIAIHVYELVQNLASQGHQVYLIAGHSQRLSEVPILHPNVELIQNKYYRWSHLGQLLCALSSLLILMKINKKHQLDVVHWHNLIYESLVLRVFQTSAIKIFTNHSSGYTRRLQNPWQRKWQLPFLLSSANAIVCPSRLRAKVTKACYSGLVVCIPNGVNTSLYYSSRKDPALLARLGLTPDQLIIAAPVRAEHVKGVDRILRVLDQISVRNPKCVLLVFGDGSSENALQEQSQQLGVSQYVVFVGGVSKSEMNKFYGITDLSIMLSREEGGVPYSALESLSCGVPLIATKVGGLNDLSTCDKGVLLIDDESQLPQALDDMMKRKNMSADFEQTLHEWVESHYSSQSNGTQTTLLYKRLLSE